MFIAPLRYWYEVTGYRPERWGPGYDLPVKFRDKTEKMAHVTIDGIKTDECPRSILLRNPELFTLIETFNHERSVKGGLGSPSRWPGAFYDAMSLLDTHEKIDKAARQTAVHSV